MALVYKITLTFNYWMFIKVLICISCCYDHVCRLEHLMANFPKYHLGTHQNLPHDVTTFELWIIFFSNVYTNEIHFDCCISDEFLNSTFRSLTNY